MFVDQQDVKLTIPISKGTFAVLDEYPIFQVQFTDLQGSPSDRHEFSLENAPDFLTINKHSGEIFFHRNLPRHQKALKIFAQVVNTATKTFARTSLELTFVEMPREEFCLNFSCFYDRIRYLTPEFHNRRGNKEQILGDLRPSLYQRVCDDMSFLYLLGNGR